MIYSGFMIDLSTLLRQDRVPLAITTMCMDNIYLISWVCSIELHNVELRFDYRMSESVPMVKGVYWLQLCLQIVSIFLLY